MHILVVDDGPEYLRAMGRLITRRGHTFTGALSHGEAMAILRREGRHIVRPTINLAICDYYMGAVTGVELLQDIKADPTLASLPVVILSSGDQSDVVEAGYAAGCAGWITKDALLNKHTIDGILSYWDRCEKVEV